MMFESLDFHSKIAPNLKVSEGEREREERERGKREREESFN